MTTIREAATIALKTLECPGKAQTSDEQAAITALRAALAEPVQEPVAWRTFDGEGGYDYRTYEDNEDYAAEWAKRNPRHVGWVEPLYAAPHQPPAEPVHEPVAWRFEARHIDSAWAVAVTLKHPGPEGVYMRNVMPLYTAPIQRKPLTEGEISKILDDVLEGGSLEDVARAIERAHGITE